MRDLIEYNKELQKSTIYGDETIAMIQSQGLNMGIEADRIKEATKSAIGLASAYGMQLSTAMMLIARASQGQTQMLSRYGIVLGENLSAEEKYNRLLQFGTRNMVLAEDKTKTLSGAIAQMSNAYSDAMEAVGAQFAPAISGVAGIMQNLSESFSNLSPEWQRFIVLTGTLTTGMIALKGVLGINAAISAIAGNAGVSASRQKVKATSEEIAMEKALQKEKLTTIALTKAQEDVARAKAAVSEAEAKQKRALSGGSANLEAISASDENVRRARTELEQYEKQLKKAEDAARKAAMGVQVLNQSVSGDQDFAAQRATMVESLKETKRSRIAIAAKLQDEEDKLDRLRAEIQDAQQGVNAALSSLKVAPDEQEALDLYDVNSERLSKLTAEYSKTEKAAKEYNSQLDALAKSHREQVKALNEFDAARKSEADYVASLPENIAAQNVLNDARKKGTVTVADLDRATAAHNAVLSNEAREAEIAALAEEKKNLALRMGCTEAEANAIASQFAANAHAAGAVKTSLWGRSMDALKVKAASAAVAVKGLAASMLPMLIISGVVAGVDWLINRSKEAAKWQAELAQKEYDRAKQAIE